MPLSEWRDSKDASAQRGYSALLFLARGKRVMHSLAPVGIVRRIAHWIGMWLIVWSVPSNKVNLRPPEFPSAE